MAVASGVFFSVGPGAVQSDVLALPTQYTCTPLSSINLRFVPLGSHWSLAEALHRENACSMYWNCFRLGGTFDMGSY